MTNSEIDRLGNQLKLMTQPEVGFDLRALDVYRLSFESATRQIEQSLRTNGLLGSTQRTKSTPSIIAKLRRKQTMRLRQIQDISGFRFIVDSLTEQDEMVERLANIFEEHTINDKRIKPSSGYRAMHFIVRILGKKVEIQVRTLFQHQWAELSEMIADHEGHDLKYEGGDQRISKLLSESSDTIYQRELTLMSLNQRLSKEQIKEEFKALLVSLSSPIL